MHINREIKVIELITFSHLDSIKFDDNFKDSFMQEKVDKMASKVN